MANARLGQWLYLLVVVLILLKTEGFFVGITYVDNAVAKGAGDFSFLFVFRIKLEYILTSNKDGNFNGFND